MNIKDLNKNLSGDIFTGKIILIDGPWGSGKTFEVKRFIDKGKGKKYYASLFGVESLKELTETLYCLVHPVKSRKNGVNGVSISLLGEGISFGADFSGDTVVTQLKEGRGKTIIFDDIERVDFSKIKMKNILGYAERLSLLGFAVVLVMNSKELDGESGKALDEFYEKVVDKKYVIDCCDEEVLANQFRGLGVSLDGVKDYFKSNIRMAKKVSKVFRDLKDLAPEEDRQNLFEICVKTITGIYGKDAMETYNNYQNDRTDDMLKFIFFDEDGLPSKELAKKMNAVVYSNNIFFSNDNLSIVKGIALYDYDGDNSFLEEYYKQKSNTLYDDSFILEDSEKEKLFRKQLSLILGEDAPSPKLALQAIISMYEEGYKELVDNYHEDLVKLFSSEFYSEYIMTSSAIDDKMRVEGFKDLITDVRNRIKDSFNNQVQKTIKDYMEDNRYTESYKYLMNVEGKRDICINDLVIFFNKNNYFLDYIDKNMPCLDYWYFLCEEASIIKKNGSSDEFTAVLTEMASKDIDNKALNKRAKSLISMCSGKI